MSRSGVRSPQGPPVKEGVRYDLEVFQSGFDSMCGIITSMEQASNRQGRCGHSQQEIAGSRNVQIEEISCTIRIIVSIVRTWSRTLENEVKSLVSVSLFSVSCYSLNSGTGRGLL
jgi:hypothetical protein